jgi:anti-anti-sigma regulatory factor
MTIETTDRNIVTTLRDAAKNLNAETSLDFSSVARLDTAGLRALEDLADAAEAKSVKPTLRGINVAAYKVLKLTKLTRRFSFVD